MSSANIFLLMVSKTYEIYVTWKKIKLHNRKLDCDEPQHLFPASCLTGKDEFQIMKHYSVTYSDLSRALQSKKKKAAFFDWLASTRPVHCVINAYLDE